VFEDLNELDDELKQQATVEPLRHNVFQKRFVFTMEANIGRVLNLYASLLESARNLT